MKSRIISFFIAVFVLCAALLGCAGRGNKHALPEAAGHHPRRIVSLAPTITETLFAIGLDREIAGVTDYCNYPPEARKKPRTGGLVDQNFETIIDLKPDLVIAMPCHAQTVSRLEELGIKTLTIKNETIGDLLGSMLIIGKATGKERQAEKLVKTLRGEIEAVRAAHAGTRGKKPRVLIVVGRNPGTLQSIFVAGRNTFFNQLLTISGGENVFGDSKKKYIQPSLEEIVLRNPDIIIESRVGKNFSLRELRQIKNEWNGLGDVAAVKNNRVYIWTEDYAAVPGPRIILLLNKLNMVVNEPRK
ncbi:MAG TPA: ABC transporter substrate-binding protein [bacterium]|nr:ABC transporter substrate-binding protein [bacterium]